MNKLIKLIGIFLLPIAALIFVLSFVNLKTSKRGKEFFIKEFDEQNIYG